MRKVAQLNELVNQQKADELVSQVLEKTTVEVINTDFIERQIETFGDPSGRLSAIGLCPDYYFSPAGKRIRVPNVSGCVVSQNGVLMKFERDGKLYIPLFSRKTKAFLGYHEETAFYAKATVTNDPKVKVALKTDLNLWVTDLEYPDEPNGLARYKAFIEQNKTKPGIILNYSDQIYNQILVILVQLPQLHFETVEGNGSPFLFDMAKQLAQLQTYLNQSNDRLTTLNGILNSPTFSCSAGGKATDDPICKVYNCVYNSSLSNQDRDLLNARLDLQTRQKLLSLLAQHNLTSGWLPVGCVASADGEGTILSLLRSTPENHQKAILDHIYSTQIASSYSPLQAFLTNLDGANFDELLGLMTTWATTYYPSSEAWSTILQRSERAKRNVLLLGEFTDGYELTSYSNGGKTYLNFKITINTSMPQQVYQRAGVDAREYMVVKFSKDFTLGSQQFVAGQVYQLPALLVYEIMTAMKRQARVDAAKFAFYGGLAVLGIAEIEAAQTGLETTLALLDMGFLSSDIIINEALATKLNQTAEGKAFLDQYNKFVLIYGSARIYSELTGLTKDLRRFADEVNDLEAEALTTKIESKIAQGTGSLETSIQAGLKSRGLIQSNIDNIIIRAMYVDDAIGGNKMLTMIDDLTNTPNFKNPEDLLSNLGNVVDKSGNIDISGSLNLMNEFKEGKYWLDHGNEVYISKNWTKGGDEVDVTVVTTGTLIECKRVSSGNYLTTQDRFVDIVDKFNNESKLSSIVKNQYPKHYGELLIDNSSNAYYYLNKRDFIDALKNGINSNAPIIGDGVNQISLQKILKLDGVFIINKNDRFIINKSDW
jgi:hypothetical protein